RNRDLVFEFNTPVKLKHGIHWLSGWVVRPDISSGFWLWIGQTPPTLSEAYWHEPSGDSGLGTDPIPISQAFGIDPQDQRFTIEGVAVPEPSPGMILPGLSVLLLWLNRRRWR